MAEVGKEGSGRREREEGERRGKKEGKDELKKGIWN